MSMHSLKRGGKARRKAIQNGLRDENGRPVGLNGTKTFATAAPLGASVAFAAAASAPAAAALATSSPAAVTPAPAIVAPSGSSQSELSPATPPTQTDHTPVTQPAANGAIAATTAAASSATAGALASNGVVAGATNGTVSSAPMDGAAAAPTHEAQAVTTAPRPAPPAPTPAPTPAPVRPSEPEPEEKPQREPLLAHIGAVAQQRAVDLSRWAATHGERLWHGVRGMTVEQWAWVAVLALAAGLRIWDLGGKPLHHDESMHAYYSYVFARDPSSYVYDPLLHGPFQFHVAGLIFAVLLGLEWLFRAGSVAGHPWINDATARIAPALFGIGIVGLPYFLRRELGRIGALIAALLLAISPSFVYFSRFLREDIYFNFFMFAMVVCAVRFARGRETRWLVGLFAATVLAYATFEGIFLTFAIFGAFLAALAAWELGEWLARRLPTTLTWGERLIFSRAGLLLLLCAVGSSLALLGLSRVHAIGAYASAHPNESTDQLFADLGVPQLERNTVVVLLWVSIALAVFVISVLLFQMLYEPAPAPLPAAEAAGRGAAESDEEEDYYDTTRLAHTPVRRVDRINAALEAPDRWKAQRLAALDPERQPFLTLLLRVQWVQWFVAVVVAWVLFAVLYWVVPGGQVTTWGDGFQLGVGRGIWQGLYYWATQQEVARGGQPWYYYLLLIPLYEQLAIVFGLAGIVYSLFRPSRFRIFLIWWFVASLALYSWAGEKMPWLTIQILLPLMLLAAIALERVIFSALALVSMYRSDRARFSVPAMLRAAPGRSAAGILGTLGAVLLLIPMVHSMLVVTYVEPADGPREMMVYVQTTTDVTTVVNQINAADKQMYGGKHQLKIAVGQQEEWPFYWYLRDYYMDQHPSQYVYFDYPVSDPNAPQQDVLLLLPSDGAQFMQLHPTGYTMHQYKLRSWWDEAYKPLPGEVSPSQFLNTGVGLGPYLSYGSNPPPNAKFDLGRAANRLWRWLWLREPLGSTDGSFDFVMIVRNGVPIQLGPGVTP
jgi:predicted membrane-bound mannosyltransferase